MTTVFHRVGHYEIHEEIGRGGMAVVFLATDTQTNQKVALKLVSIETDRDGQQVLEAERWGAKLQEEFCREGRSVPVAPQQPPRRDGDGGERHQDEGDPYGPVDAEPRR